MSQTASRVRTALLRLVVVVMAVVSPFLAVPAADAGSAGATLTPEQVGAFRSISVNGYFPNGRGCALDKDGAAWCWGSNFQGELGDGSPIGTSSAVPVKVAGNHKFVQIDSGSGNVGTVCALDVEGQLWCWGGFLEAVRGDGVEPPSFGGDSVSATTPVQVAPGRKWTSFSWGVQAGVQLCALDAEQQAWCWGFTIAGTQGGTLDPRGNNGAGSTVPVEGFPTRVVGEHRFVSLGGYGLHACGLDTEGAVWCWGRENNTGFVRAQVPTRFLPDHTFEQFSTGPGVGCGIKADGSVRCLLSEGLDTPLSDNGFVVGGGPYAAVSAGSEAVCLLDAAGTAKCFGASSNGALGTGSNTFTQVPASAPATVVGGLRFIAINAGEATVCGITVERAAYCWGHGLTGGRGDGTTTRSQGTPRPVAGNRQYGVSMVTVTGATGAGGRYGDAPGTIAPTYSGLEPGGEATLTTPATCTTTATETSPVGTYPVTCSGAAGSGYVFRYVESSYEVTKRPLTVTASSGSSVFGVAPGPVTPSYDGFVNDEDADDLTTAPTCAQTVTAATPVGSSATNCTGGFDESYSFDYEAGTWQVAAAPVAITTSATSGLANLLGLRTSFTATVRHALTGAAVSGARVSFTVSGKVICSAVTNASGVAACSSATGGVILAGPYAATTTAAGNYLGGRASGSIRLL